jgi:copper chaperone CopZ
MVTQSFTVTGMNCDHCVASVTEELTELPGVREVTVDLPTGHVEVSSDAELDAEDVRQAITGAGFKVLLPVAG